MEEKKFCVLQIQIIVDGVLNLVPVSIKFTDLMTVYTSGKKTFNCGCLRLTSTVSEPQ